MNKKLKIVTWNANSIKNKLKEFKNFLYENDYDIAGICETKTDKNYKMNIPGYKVYINSRNNRGGGVAIVIKQNIDHTYYKKISKGNLEFIGVRIATNSSNLVIGQVYKPPKKHLVAEELKSILLLKKMLY